MGGRGGSSGMARSSTGIVNRVGASDQAVSFMRDAFDMIRTTGTAQIVINETKDQSSVSRPRADNPANRDLEDQLTRLAEDNGLMINFQTKTESTKGVVTRFTYGTSRTATQTKKRIMYAYRRP